MHLYHHQVQLWEHRIYVMVTLLQEYYRHIVALITGYISTDMVLGHGVVGIISRQRRYSKIMDYTKDKLFSALKNFLKEHTIADLMEVIAEVLRNIK